MRKLAVVLIAVLLLAGCNRGEDDPTVGADGTTSSSSTSTTAADTTTTVFSGGPLPQKAPATAATRAYLSDVRVASHDGYDRVVFEFEDAVPGYLVEYTKRPVTEDGSGDTVEVEGSTLVLVRMEDAATARITGEKVTTVYQGPERVRTKGAIVREVVDSGDFEGTVAWVVGLDTEPSGVKVTTLTSPFRLVVDFGVPR